MMLLTTIYAQRSYWRMDSTGVQNIELYHLTLPYILGVCRLQQKKLVAAIEMAWDHGKLACNIKLFHVLMI